MTKAEKRREVLAMLRAQGPGPRAVRDRAIKERLQALAEYKSAKNICFYVSFAGEVDTQLLIDEALKAGRRVVVPVITGGDLELSEISRREAELVRGPYGILQPARTALRPFPKEDLDLVIVPGVAFARDGRRLGRGKGFYDKFLKDLPRRIKKVGLAYDFQIAEDLPAGPHDIPVDIVVTN